MKQDFLLDGKRRYFDVVAQTSKKIGATYIQLSRVLDMNSITYGKDEAVLPYRYIYEEIDKDDMVVYTHFWGKDQIKKIYKWAIKPLGIV
jgi:hypothetical protein